LLFIVVLLKKPYKSLTLESLLKTARATESAKYAEWARFQSCNANAPNIKNKMYTPTSVKKTLNLSGKFDIYVSGKLSQPEEIFYVANIVNAIIYA
jgi:hypothetical protein